jgi:hypothetical protein
MKDFNTGYCPGCSIKVKPDEEIKGFFNYVDFEVPITEYGNKKMLIFSPMSAYCRPSER